MVLRSRLEILLELAFAPFASTFTGTETLCIDSVQSNNMISVSRGFFSSNEIPIRVLANRSLDGPEQRLCASQPRCRDDSRFPDGST